MNKLKSHLDSSLQSVTLSEERQRRILAQSQSSASLRPRRIPLTRVLAAAAAFCLILSGTALAANELTDGALLNYVRILCSSSAGTEESTVALEDHGDYYRYEADSFEGEIAKDGSWGMIGGSLEQDNFASFHFNYEDENGDPASAIYSIGSDGDASFSRSETWDEEKSLTNTTAYVTLNDCMDPQLFQDFMHQPNTAELLRELNQRLNDSFSCLQTSYMASSSQLGRYGYFDVDVRFVEGENKSLLNQEFENPDTGEVSYYTPLQSIQVNPLCAAGLSELVAEGRGFTDSDFTYVSGQPIPVLMGSSYQQYYQLGDTLSLNYCGETPFNFQVVGFLAEDCTIFAQSKETTLNYFIITPYFDIDDLNAPDLEDFYADAYYDIQLNDTRIVLDGMTDEEVQDTLNRLQSLLEEFGLEASFSISDVTTSRLGFFPAGE